LQVSEAPFGAASLWKVVNTAMLFALARSVVTSTLLWTMSLI